MKKILLISYVFAPVGYVGTFRTLKYCKFLPGLGWKPFVLTIDPRNVPHKDEGLLDQLPAEVVICRTRDLDPARWFRARGKRKLDAVVQRGGNVEDALDEYARRSGAPSLLEKAKLLIKAILTDSPDSHVFWAPFAVWRGLRLVRRQGIDIVYSSTPPHSSHAISYLISVLTRRPLVLDFRDPWVTDRSQSEPHWYYRLLARFEGWLKARIVRRASRVLCATPEELGDWRAEYPELPEDRFVSITNGFDPEDFDVAQPEQDKSEKLVLTHAGTIYPGVADELFSALKLLYSKDDRISEKLVLHLYGDIDLEYMPIVRELEDAGIVVVHGLVSQRRALAQMKCSDVLVILRGGRGHFGASHIPAKVFEYLYARKPVLAVVREGLLREVLMRSGLALVVDSDNPARLASKIMDAVQIHATGGLSVVPNDEYINGFRRDVLASVLSAELDSVLEDCR